MKGERVTVVRLDKEPETVFTVPQAGLGEGSVRQDIVSVKYSRSLLLAKAL